MATWQAAGRWAAVLAAAFLAAPGHSSEPVAPAPVTKAQAPAAATPADGAAPAWAKVSQLQIDSARKVGVPVAKELDLGGAVTMKLVLIPAGKFMMGEEKDRHEVTLSKPFYVGVTEVTQAQYQAIMGTNPGKFKGATNPVEMVTWNNAEEFCKKTSEKTRQAVRLPTEAEWEYACRAGMATVFSFGDADSALDDYEWYIDNGGGTTHPVGQKKPNAWGLYDMHGNVREWCADWFEDYPKGAVTDPQGPASGTYRVLRGGSCGSSPGDCRSALRIFNYPDSRCFNFGFRVVVSVSAPGLSSEPVAPAPVQKAEAPAAATPADGAVPEWAKVSQLQIDSARKAGVPAAKELDLGGGVTMKLVFIPAGKFMMGSPDSEKGRGKDEGPQHEVTLCKPFYLGVTEVTQAQYQAIMGTNPSYFENERTLYKDPNYIPVENVSWHDATEFCKRFSEKTRQAVRLPTEAEWEYACRAGTATAFSFGDADSALGDYAWYDGNSAEPIHPAGTTRPVNQKRPNAWGLFDMHGNLWEWCADWHGDYPNGTVTDPQGPASGTSRVLRGGCWYGPAVNCRAARRNSGSPDTRLHIIGFRVAVSVSAPGL